jgi:hypothetical protein
MGTMEQHNAESAARASEEAPDGAPTPASAFRSVLPKLAVSLLLGGLFAWLVARGGVPLIPKQAAFDRVAWWAVPAYAGCLVVTHFFRASRWRFLIAPVRKLPLRDVLALNWIGFFAIFALPLRIGEFARPALTKARTGISVSVGFGTIAVERVVDGLLSSLFVAWALFALPRLETDDQFARALPMYGYVALTVFSSAFVALGVFLWKRDFAVQVIRRTVGVVSERGAAFVAAKVASVADGVRSIGSARLFFAFLGETLIYWSTNAAGMWLLARGVGLDLEFGHAVAVMGILAIGILLPAGPGLFGNFQLAISTALKLYFVPSMVGEQGSVYIFLMYSVQAVVMVLFGVVPLYVMRIPFSALLRMPPESIAPPARRGGEA